MRFLIACDTLVASGGLLRFERLAHVLLKRGEHEFAYLVHGKRKPEFSTQLCILKPAEAKDQAWDAVLAPGAGFPENTIDAFGALRAANFGVRIQMVLNDRSVRDRFLRLNARFTPDIVIFNNFDWAPGMYRDFRGNRFHHLIGAVDLDAFKLMTKRREDRRFVIGAQIAKNPRVVAAMLEHLPQECSVHFFGVDRANLWPAILSAYGDRVAYSGPLFNDDLSAFYQNVDCVISAETHAGWANVVAEAMASGTPVVTTPAGATSLARHEETALVVPEPDSTLLAHSVVRLRDDAQLRLRLVAAALTHIQAFDWPNYAQGFLDIVQQYDGRAHYAYAPQLGLFGKATWEERSSGLEPLIASRPRTLLDVGAAEGLISRAFQDAGAERIDAYERDPGRVFIGQSLLRDGARLEALDLTGADALSTISARAPTGGYDLVLYLGVHHHLPSVSAPRVAQVLFGLAKDRLAVRTTQAAFDRDCLSTIAAACGFELESKNGPSPDACCGPLWIFKRAQPT